VREQDTGRKVAGRVLGDEWDDWDGNVESHDGEIHATARPFALMLSLVLMMYWGIAILACYLVLPRLRELHPYLGVAGVALAAAFILLSSLWLFTLGLSMAFGRSVLVGAFSRRLVLHFMNPFLMRLARIFGFSRDRIGHSFIRLNNALARAVARETEKTIVLLPRCLRKDVRKEVLEIAERFGAPTYTVAGGEQARQAVSREKPEAVVAVACERDLASGIHDVSPSIVVVGIPNVRREGPCRNTEVDTEAFERALELFKGAGK
jgi:hypothetical protein